MHEQSTRVYSAEGLSPTLHTCGGGNQEIKIEENEKIRKLTPKEYIKLMGFDDEDYEKLVAIGMSNTQIYKQSGNSICVPVLEELFKELL